MTTLRRFLALGTALFVALLLLSISPASAHTGFESSEPVDGATTNAEIVEIVLRFTGTADPVGEGFVIRTPSGGLRTPDSAIANADKTIWTLTFEPAIGTGIIGVRWTVQAPDAHPITGSFSFTVDVPATVVPAESQPAATDEGSPAAPPSTSTGANAATAEPTTDRAADGAPGLEEFLSTQTNGAANTAAAATIGRFLSLLGTALVIGGLAFASRVLRGNRADARSVFKTVQYASIVIVLGATVDLVTLLAVANNGWSVFWSDDAIEAVGLSASGLAVGLRAGAGMLLFLASGTRARCLAPLERTTPQREAVLAGSIVNDTTDAAGTAAGGGAGQLPDTGDTTLGLPASTAVMVGVALLLASFSLTGHAANEGDRWITGAVDMVHVLAGSTWAGGVAALAVVLWQRHRERRRLNALDLTMRFSVLAAVAAVVAGVAGTVLAVTILDSVGDLWTTTWGRLLLAKLIAVTASASVGGYNHFVVLPSMADEPANESHSIRLRNTASGEALLLLAVIVVTAFLIDAGAA